MKSLLVLLFSLSMLFAQSEQLIIDSKHFETDDSKGLSIFTGNVKLKKNKDKLNSDKLEIYIKPNSQGKAKEPLMYIATGNVDFEIFTLDKHYIGKGDKVVFDPKKEEYTVTGNGYLKEVIGQKELFGEKIFINQLTGSAKVSGSEEKPVRFIINIENKNKK